MKIHYLQHEPFEDLAYIERWALEKDFQISRTLLFKNEAFPKVGDFDWLFIMGGSMNIYEHEKYPWLKEEKDFIKRAIKRNVVVIGICLGAQLVADVLGGKVTRNAYKEIGWHEVSFIDKNGTLDIFSGIPSSFIAFHWHGDTFSVPENCSLFAKSEACRHQGFLYNEGRVLALQFHLEASPESIDVMLEKCSSELIGSKYVQSIEEIRTYSKIEEIYEILSCLLNNVYHKFIAYG